MPAIVALLAVLASSRPARGDVWSDVAALLERLDYDEAVARLERLAADEERPARDRLRALELQAVAHVGAGRDDEARAVFTRLRSGDPGWSLADASYSPKIRRLFEATGAPGAPGAPLTLEADPAAAREVTVHARFDPRVVYGDSIELRFRWSDDGPWSTATGVRETGGAWFRVPRPAGVPGTMRLRAVALVRAPSGEIVARAGADEEPSVVEIVTPVIRPAAEPRARGSSIFGQWWFWTAAGVLVAGGVTVAIVAASGGDDLPLPTLGSQTMR